MVSDSAARSAARAAATVLACAGAASHLGGAAADAWFLAAIGPGRLGLAVAGSSLLVALVVAVVGGLADRRDRRATLVALAAGGAATLVALALAHPRAPGPTAAVAFVAVKQLQAAVELALWVAVSDWFDARALRRLVPTLAAAGGSGGAVGAALVAPIARAGGPGALVLAAAALMAVAAVAAARAPAARRVGAALAARSRGGWGDGLGALTRQPLARGLAVLVAVAGVAASLTYVALGAAAAAHHRDARELAAFLGHVRMAGQVAMIAAQVLVAPRLLGRLGVGGALVVAPVTACLGALGVVGSGSLVAAAMLQVQARITDGAIEGPAEKLAQNLLPVELRGRLGGWLEGPAKRTGAIVGGLGAGAVAAAHLGWLVLGTAVVWLAAALVVRARLPRWALGALARPAGDDGAVPLGDRAARRVVAQLLPTAPARAVEVAARLHHDGFDARPLVCDVYRQAPAARPAALAALDRLCPPGARDLPTARALAGAPADDDASERARLGLVGRLARGAAVALDGDARPATAAAHAIAHARLAGDDAAVADALADACADDDPAIAAAGHAELAAEVADAAATAPARGLPLARRLVRRLRGDGLPPPIAAAAVAAVAALVARAGDDAEAQWLRADVRELLHGLATPPHVGAPAVTAAALTALAAWPGGPDADDVATIADALGARDDELRVAAEAALRGLGPTAVVALVRTTGLGRRAARDRAVALLGELAVDARELARMVSAELDALDRLAVHAGALAALGDRALDRRLDERLAEVGHTALLLIAAQARSPAIARAARAVRQAATVAERARAVEILDATLPRAVAARVVPVLDPGALPARVHGARARRGAVGLDDAVTAELTAGDALTRDLLVRALPPERRREFRGALTSAASAAAAAIAPLDLLRRVTADIDDDDVPPAVDVLLALAEVPALAGLTTPQLAAIAERGEVLRLGPGEALTADGERLDALLVVLDGAVAVGDRRVGRGQAVDELAPIAPRPAPRVAALEPTRLFRLRRLDLDELIDDEPGLGSALVRYLGEALRAR